MNTLPVEVDGELEGEELEDEDVEDVVDEDASPCCEPVLEHDAKSVAVGEASVNSKMT